MLHKLMLREWILLRRALVSIMGIYIAFEAYFVCRASTPRQYLIFAAAYASLITMTLFLRDDRFQATSWSCTLPVRRKDLVQARFVGAWIFAAGAVAMSILLTVVMPWSRVRPGATFEPATLFLTAFTITIVLAIALPFAIRFGFLGVMIFFVVLQILGSALLLVAVKTSRRPNPSRGLLSGGVEALTEVLVTTRDILSPPAFYLALVLFLFVLNWFGYRLAVALFQRREF
jgi:hypothetical protein